MNNPPDTAPIEHETVEVNGVRLHYVEEAEILGTSGALDNAQRDMQEAYAKATQRYVQDLKDAWGASE